MEFFSQTENKVENFKSDLTVILTRVNYLTERFLANIFKVDRTIDIFPHWNFLIFSFPEIFNNYSSWSCDHKCWSHAIDTLKDYQLSVNLESISFQIEKENVDARYKITRNYFENQNFSIFEERKVNRGLCGHFKVKQDIGLEYYIINFYASGRTLINTKNHHRELLEKWVPDLERVYEIIFRIKAAKFSCDANIVELTGQSETPGCSNFDVRDMDIDQNQKMF